MPASKTCTWVSVARGSPIAEQTRAREASGKSPCRAPGGAIGKPPRSGAARQHGNMGVGVGWYDDVLPWVVRECVQRLTWCTDRPWVPETVSPPPERRYGASGCNGPTNTVLCRVTVILVICPPVSPVPVSPFPGNGGNGWSGTIELTLECSNLELYLCQRLEVVSSEDAGTGTDRGSNIPESIRSFPTTRSPCCLETETTGPVRLVEE